MTIFKPVHHPVTPSAWPPASRAIVPVPARPTDKHAEGEVVSDSIDAVDTLKRRFEASATSGAMPSPAERMADWTELRREFKALSTAPAADAARVDALKLTLVEAFRATPTLGAAGEVARMIATLHDKPNHAPEIEAAADRLLAGHSMLEDVKLAARLIVIGEYATPVEVLRGGRLSEADKQQHIYPMNGRAADLLANVPSARARTVAAVIAGTEPTDVAPYLHCVRDIAGMQAPRRWRAARFPPDGAMSTEAIVSALRENDALPGRDPRVTDEFVARLCP